MTSKTAASATTVQIRKGAYRDSVALMSVSRTVAGFEGVTAALVAMATELNLELLAQMDAEVPSGTGPNDLVIAVRADDEATRSAALELADTELAAMGRSGTGSTGGDDAAPPRSMRSAVERAAGNGTPPALALVSVPGRYAAAEAFEALETGLDVLIFSDNVPVAHEIALKERAAELGRLVMGPDCGTAVVGGAGLGFANTVRPGPVGIVAASGTGAQQLMCLLDAAGVGVGHCLGVGGRDLSAAVGGRSTLQALQLLDADEATERIVVVSKPPAPEVAAAVRAASAALDTPVHLVLLGTGDDISAAAAEVVTAFGAPAPTWPSWFPAGAVTPRAGALRGLFCGGTLADEAMLVAARALGPIASNIPLRPGEDAWTLPADLRHDGHLVIDFGDDTLTAGRPHPMIDPSVREERLRAELADPATGVVLLDLVLGHGAHPDPAAGVAAAVRDSGGTVPVVVTLCGSSGDPQGLERQATVLTDAGAEVYLSNAAAARRALELLE
ncbi:FdrA family protein [Nocardiopsis ansamitocini]|uniref:ATP-citrate synthase/succinyl-CoA ligase C-terminal domain-containing protein n=1 Tax=Nocardiopsis ansamitocini TaxID=1670832 RepID=A0A9W6P3H6_9ACTN|nr:FdrA family protein [Nocardiopsis ansamitocini]GLU46481.1 hypothetical protein Nans01_08320 [Nocardiopsis ansamitocini]